MNDAPKKSTKVWLGPVLLFTVGVCVVFGGYFYLQHRRQQSHLNDCLFLCGKVVRHLMKSDDPEEFKAPPLKAILADLSRPGGAMKRDAEGRPVDAWGNAYVIETTLIDDGKNLRVSIISKGPDGRLDTDPNYEHGYTLPVPKPKP
jgi:hypothetical protein